ncbi:MAG: hypothetical protein CME06_18305 [Gemmatimonadetes bacterium]|nr:hypothetical protein [Gemmatimonadota bacterium]
MPETLKTVLLLALPASGKSEVRRYLAQLSPEECARDFHMGETVQLDDFPYVHLMRRIDEELESLGKARRFYVSGNDTFTDKRDWGTLIELINGDYENLVSRRTVPLEGAAEHFFDRLDASGAKVGIEARVASFDPDTRAAIATALETEVRDLYSEQNNALPESLEGKTVVIEFARGGPDGSDMPLPPPHGYLYSVAQLSPAILENASILYIWVTPEESRRKNDARTDPNDPGSILHHGVPMSVMLGEYGCDDLEWLEANATREGAIDIAAGGMTYQIPVGRFDNRVDKTTFIREERGEWDPADVAVVHEGLKGALDRLSDFWSGA